MGNLALHGFTAWIFVGAGKPEMLELADAWDSRIWWERSIEGLNPIAVTDVESLRRSASFLSERIQTERGADGRESGAVAFERQLARPSRVGHLLRQAVAAFCHWDSHSFSV